MKKIENKNTTLFSDSIIAPATEVGKGAIGIIRISGTEAITIANLIFKKKGNSKKSLLSDSNLESHKLYFGVIEDDNKILDEVLVAIFRAPHSYTGENSAEIYCHSSSYIMNRIIQISLQKSNSYFGKNKIDTKLRVATAGEFTQRAFLNGKMDLAQAEAVADLIASENRLAHYAAISQMRGGFSNELKSMRAELINLASLMELELDFSEEDVEFADRVKLRAIVENVRNKVSELSGSFSVGNAIKNGIPVAIVGSVNTGKSTLLNLLVGEDRAIVSDVKGTTRDTIEECVNIGGTTFRFIDTAGIRDSSDKIERLGIERTIKKIESASILILMLDYSRLQNFENEIDRIANKVNSEVQKVIILINKMDTATAYDKSRKKEKSSLQNLDKRVVNDVALICKKKNIAPLSIIPCSLLNSKTIPAELENRLCDFAASLSNSVGNNILITNSRHYQALIESKNSLDRVLDGIDKLLPADLLAQDLNDAIAQIASITGEISSQDILNNIFKNFCVGK